jgi:hypothetical protein
MEQGRLDKGHQIEEGQMRQGSKVVCINDQFPTDILPFYTNLPIKDRTYIVRDLGVGVALNGEAGEVVVYLESLPNPCSTTAPFPERGFNAERFRELEPPAEIEAEELAEATA